MVSSAYRGCSKYKEVSNALRLAATQKLSYRDAFQQIEVDSNKAKETSVPLPQDTNSVINARAEMNSVETQTEEKPPADTYAPQ